MYRYDMYVKVVYDNFNNTRRYDDDDDDDDDDINIVWEASNLTSSPWVWVVKLNWLNSYYSFIHSCLLRHNGSKIEQYSWI